MKRRRHTSTRIATYCCSLPSTCCTKSQFERKNVALLSVIKVLNIKLKAVELDPRAWTNHRVRRADTSDARGKHVAIGSTRGYKTATGLYTTRWAVGVQFPVRAKNPHRRHCICNH